MRCVLPFLDWPWVLASVIHKDSNEEDRYQVMADQARTNQCCVPQTDGFTMQFKELAGEMSRPEAEDLLRDSFTMCPASNIITEDRFSRGRRQGRPDQNVETVGSDHVLSEWLPMANTLRQQCPPDIVHTLKRYVHDCP